MVLQRLIKKLRESEHTDLQDCLKSWQNQVEDDMPLVVSSPPITHIKEPLTFGVEIEFVIAAIPWGCPDPEPHDYRQAFQHHDSLPPQAREDLIRLFIAKFLADQGTPAEAPDIRVQNFRIEDKNAWTVKSDRSIMAGEESKGYDYFQIELVSPVLPFNAKAFSSIRHLCKLLNRSFRIDVNSSCGLHCHVGDGDRGLPFNTVRNLIATLWTFEPQIETIHPRSRREEKVFCSSFRRLSRLAEMATVAKEKGCNDSVAFIGLYWLLWTTKDMEELRSVTGCRGEAQLSGNRGAYFIGDVDGTQKDWLCQKPTIEFRQHIATLDCDRIVNWVEVCVRLIEFAQNVDRTTLCKFLTKHIDQTPEQYSLQQVLKKLGMDSQGNYYTKKIADDEAEVQRVKEVRARKLAAGEILEEEGKLYSIG